MSTATNRNSNNIETKTVAGIPVTVSQTQIGVTVSIETGETSNVNHNALANNIIAAVPANLLVSQKLPDIEQVPGSVPGKIEPRVIPGSEKMRPIQPIVSERDGKIEIYFSATTEFQATGKTDEAGKPIEVPVSTIPQIRERITSLLSQPFESLPLSHNGVDAATGQVGGTAPASGLAAQQWFRDNSSAPYADKMPVNPVRVQAQATLAAALKPYIPTITPSHINIAGSEIYIDPFAGPQVKDSALMGNLALALDGATRHDAPTSALKGSAGFSFHGTLEQLAGLDGDAFSRSMAALALKDSVITKALKAAIGDKFPNMQVTVDEQQGLSSNVNVTISGLDSHNMMDGQKMRTLAQGLATALDQSTTRAQPGTTGGSFHDGKISINLTGTASELQTLDAAKFQEALASQSVGRW